MYLKAKCLFKNTIPVINMGYRESDSIDKNLHYLVLSRDGLLQKENTTKIKRMSKFNFFYSHKCILDSY